MRSYRPVVPVVAALFVPGVAVLVWALLARGARLRAPQHLLGARGGAGGATAAVSVL